jgi:hypothetical protein
VSWNKRQFIEAAYEEIGYATYTHDLQPEQLEAAMRRMDAMLATWNAKGIRIGYPIPTSPENSDLDQETNVPDKANEAIYTNLAIRIAPTIGKTASAETKRAAKTGYDALLALSVKPEQMQLPSNMPTGAGNKKEQGHDRPFSNAPDDPVAAGDDAVFDFE